MRIRMFEVTADGLASTLRTSERFTVTDGMPRGASVHRAGYDANRDVFYLVLEHESFEDIPEGSPMPHASVTIRREA